MHVFSQDGATFRVFQDSRQGGRTYMEDVACLDGHRGDGGGDDFIYLAVFDGHGGSQAAHFAKEHLLDELKGARGFWTRDRQQVAKAIRDAFVSTHKLMWKDVVSWPKTMSGLPSTAGTTASVVLIKGGYMYVAHVGDSSIVLAEKNCWANLHANCVTVDHKPDSPVELRRIENSGGQVKVKAGVPRVVWHRPKPPHKGPVRRSTHMVDIPFLAVARALGDLWSYNSEQDTFIVSPEPDVAVYKVDYKKHKFIILASDGLWNMVKPQEAVNFVEELSMERFDAVKSNPAKKLVQLALNKWAYKNLRADNTTVIVVVVGEQSDNAQNLSCVSSSDPCVDAVTVNDTDVFTDLDVNVRGNVKVDVADSNAGVHFVGREGFYKHYVKHCVGKHAGRMFHPCRKISAPGECFAQKRHRFHNDHSRKIRSHPFWDGSFSVAAHDKIIIPTKYKCLDETAKSSDNNGKSVGDVYSTASSTTEEGLIADRFEATNGECSGPQQAYSIDQAPGEVSRAMPQEEELPELNKIIVPSKYKHPGQECDPHTSLTTVGEHGGPAAAKCSEPTALQMSGSAAMKRKMSALDVEGVGVKKSRQWIGDVQNTRPTPTTGVPSGGSGHGDVVRVVTSSKPFYSEPLEINTYHEEPSTAPIISPIWPNSLDADVDSGADDDDHHFATYPCSGPRDSCSSVRRGVAGALPNGSRHSKKLLGARSQERRVTAKRLYFHMKNIKLHRTRLHIQTRFPRKY